MSFTRNRQHILTWMFAIAGAAGVVYAVFVLIRAFARVILEIQ